MKKEKKGKMKDQECCNPQSWNKGGCNASGGGVYALGFLGSVIYFISYATSFWGGVLGVLKSMVWPVFLVYELFKSLGM